MTGLEKILSEIIQEAEAEATVMIDEANAKALEIIAAAKAEGKLRADEITASTDNQVAGIRHSGKSSLALKRRQLVLAKKQDLISETINAALKKLSGLPSDEYFNLIISMAGKEVQSGTGKLLLSSADMARLPTDFAKKLEKALPKNSMLEVAESPAITGSGFILAYDEIEINCTFEAIFNARHDEFEDITQRVLFE